MGMLLLTIIIVVWTIVLAVGAHRDEKAAKKKDRISKVEKWMDKTWTDQ